MCNKPARSVPNTRVLPIWAQNSSNGQYVWTMSRCISWTMFFCPFFCFSEFLLLLNLQVGRFICSSLRQIAGPGRSPSATCLHFVAASLRLPWQPFLALLALARQLVTSRGSRVFCFYSFVAVHRLRPVPSCCCRRRKYKPRVQSDNENGIITTPPSRRRLFAAADDNAARRPKTPPLRRLFRVFAC